MAKIAALLWLIVGTTLAGIAMAVIVTIPSFFDQGMRLIPLFCGGAFLVAIPIAFFIAKQIATPSRAGH